MNQVLKLGLIGCGGMARFHMKKLNAQDDAQLVALCDVNMEIIDQFIENNLGELKEVPARFTDTEAMFANCDLDGVMIVSPHTLHFKHGMQALDAGCHVFMEKPMVTSTDQAQAIKTRVEETGKVLTVGYNTPCTPNFQYLRDVVRTGQLGRLELVNGFISQDWMRLSHGSWRQEPGLSGGGQAYDSGAHLLNSLVWTVESAPSRVCAFIDNKETKVDINSVISVGFENGVLASITIGGNSPGAGGHMVFIFDRGRIEIDGWSGQWIKVFDENGKRVENPGIEGEENSPLENFIGAVLGREEQRTKPENGVNQSKLMDAIYSSARTGTVISAT
jgi:predicted dehydrogenase